MSTSIAHGRNRRAKHPRPRSLWLAMLAMAIVLACAPSALAQGGHWPGVLNLNRTLTFYVVNPEGVDFDLTVRWRNNWQTSMDTPVLVRVLDPNEQGIARHLAAGNKITGVPGWNTVELAVTAAGAGVYQVIVTGFGGEVDFDISPALSWGVYGYPMLEGTDHLDDAYIYLPPNLPSLNVQCTGTVEYLRLSDQNGVTHINISGTNGVGSCALPPGTDQIWHLESQASGQFGVGFGVAPIILCPDEATALAIRSSVDVLADGTICFHKFQVQAHELLAQYAALDPAAFAVTPPDLGASVSQWIADPPRNSLLIGWYGVFSVLPSTLEEQNLDPASPWFGCIRAWHDSNGASLANPWTTYERLNLTDCAPGLGVLAAVHAVDDPLNPLHHNVNLRNRIIVAALRQMMMIREHELPEPTWIAYDGGTKAFNFARISRAFPWVVQQCPSNVQAVWTAGMRRYTDLMVLTAVPEIANQWSFIMMGLQNFARGSGEQQYRDYVQMHITWMLQRRQFGYGAMPAGYFTEGEGPDSSYAGINMHNLAWLSEDAANQQLKSAVIESFRLYNHTVAPEPNGDWLGIASFNHRSPTDWTCAQWTTGAGILADDSAEAAVMLGHCMLPWRPAHGAAELQQQQTSVQNNLVYYQDAYDDPTIGPCIPDGPMIPMVVWDHYMATPIAGAQLPMKASDRFTRKLGNEFFAVRRPSYYAFLYCGKTMEEWRQPMAPTDPNIQYPRNGGGLSMLWSPKFGSSILAKNWSAFSTNGLIARKGGQYRFEDYWKTDGALQASQSRATIEGKLTDNKLSYRRRLSFQEDRIICDIRMQASAALNYDRLWECFPYPLDKPDPLQVSLYDAEGNKMAGNNKLASAIVFHNDANEVHIIAFGAPRQCEFGTNTSTDAYGQQREYGRVLTQLPPEWNAGQARVVKWAARVVKPNQVKATITQLVGSLK